MGALFQRLWEMVPFDNYLLSFEQGKLGRYLYMCRYSVYEYLISMKELAK